MRDFKSRLHAYASRLFCKSLISKALSRPGMCEGVAIRVAMLTRGQVKEV
jgi:hypothetical protein